MIDRLCMSGTELHAVLFTFKFSYIADRHTNLIIQNYEFIIKGLNVNYSPSSLTKLSLADSYNYFIFHLYVTLIIQAS